MPFSQVNQGSLILNPLYSYDNQGIVDFRGVTSQRVLGIAKLTDTLQTSIPIYVPSGKKDQSKYPDKLLVIPSGSQVNYLGFRLPGYYYQTPEAYGYLPTGVTIIGTTGEKVKVSPTTTTTYTQLSPSIVSASSAYTPDATATAYRGIGVADASSPSILRTLGADTTLAINVSNAGDTAVGTGIRLSTTGAVAHIVVEVYYSYAKTPSYFDEIMAGGDIYRNTFS